MTLTVQYIADILQKGLALPEGRVWIYNQRRDIPSDDGLCVVVGVMGIKPFGVNNRFTGATDGATETLSQQFQETISIQAFSRSTVALERMGEIVGALHSTYAEQVQEAAGFKIGAVPTTINDVSGQEGAAMLFRLAITVNVIRAYSTEAPVEYYDTFSSETKTERGTA